MKEFLSDETLPTFVLQKLSMASQSATFKFVDCPLHQLRLQERDQMNCTICQRATKKEGACVVCELKVKACLTELPALQYEAGNHLAPARTGSGAVSSERSIGINVNALDFSMATDLLHIMHGWEVPIRIGRGLTPPAYLDKEPTIEAEVDATCSFHLAHLDYSLFQPWAVEFASDVYGLHAKGRAAAKKFSEQARRIPCPTDDCKRFVVIDVENLSDEVSCFGCKQSWTVARLVKLAMSNPNRKFFLDVEAISLWLKISQREIYRIVKRHDIEKRGSLYNFGDILKVVQI